MRDTYKVYEVGIRGCALGCVGYENLDDAMKYLKCIVEKGNSAYIDICVCNESSRYSPSVGYRDGEKQ